jgi:DNA polymerase-3 subunit gamma/tau
MQMSYLVLARKWRPLQFEDVVAQDHVTTTLMNAIKNERLASAYLFAGPRGVGKTTTARIFAKAINCENGLTPTPCNQCSSCQEITESRSIEVFEIDGASNRGIDEVRNLRENLRYAAPKGKYKIYIIDEVHMLTTEAFNALLKSLEEPPPKVLFIFATTEAHKVPATILSRCQRYDFRRMPQQEIVEQLQKICAEEKVEIDDESLYLLAKKSEGSMRDSQSLLDQVISFCGQKVKSEELTDLLGIIDQELFFNCTDCLVNRNIEQALTLVETIYDQGHDLGDFLNGLTEHFRNILVVKATSKTDLLEGAETYASRYQEVGDSFSETDLLRLVNLSSEAAIQIKHSFNPKMILEMTLVKMIKMDKSVELDQLIDQIKGLESTPTASRQEPKPEPPAPENAARTSVAMIKEVKGVFKEPPAEQTAKPITNGSAAVAVSLSKVKDKWTDIIDEVRIKKIHLGSFLTEGYPTKIQDGFLEISFGKENGFHINTINQNKVLIQDVIRDQTGFGLSILCKKNEGEDFREIIAKHRPVSEPKATEAEPSLQVPIIKKVIEMFDGEIVR